MEYILQTQLFFKKKLIIMQLKNKSSKVLRDFKLCFSIPLAQVQNVEKAKILYSLGSYIEFAPLQEIRKEESWTFSFNTPILSNISDAPQGVFIVQDISADKKYEKILEVHVEQAVCEDMEIVDDANDVRIASILEEASAESIDVIIPIIPMPVYAEYKDSKTSENLMQSYNETHKYYTKITLENVELQAGKDAFILLVQDMEIESYLIADASTHAHTINISFIARGGNNTHSPYYEINISHDNIEIKANSKGGVFYALISLQQIWMAKKGKFACMSIQDYPRFSWRGFMLDTARQYYSPKEIKRILRIMAIHKLNVFHWHLTDDEAWRVDLETYPHLAEEYGYRGYGKRIPPLFASGAQPNGGTYSKTEIQEIISYADNFCIEIMPEFDIPGHSYALCHSDSRLQEDDDKSVYQSVQGYSTNILNPALDYTYEVIENIVEELCKLFDKSQYFHFGGDEVPEASWSGSTQMKRMKKNKSLSNHNAVLEYFYKRIAHKIHSYQKYTAVWEEGIANKSLDKNTVVFAWQSDKAGLDAARRGYEVVVCPAKYYYFDIRQSHSPYEIGASWAGCTHVYDSYCYEPIPDNFKQAKNIIGVQANFWSEYFTDKSAVDYMIFPRLAAFAETAWIKQEKKNFNDFVLRMEYGYKQMLDKMSYAYRL